jgi:hypothetical protein
MALFMKPTSNGYPIVVLNIEEAFGEFLGELYDPRNKDARYSNQEIMIATLRFLHFEHQMSEAREAMMIDMVANYQPVFESNYDIQRMNDVISRFLDAVHAHLHECGLYDEDGVLQYTFGGWAASLSPFLIHPTQINQHIKAASLRVESQYEVASDYYHSHYWRPATYLKQPQSPDEEKRVQLNAW